MSEAISLRTRPVAQTRQAAVKPFALMMRDGTIRPEEDGARVSISRALLLTFFRPILMRVQFDEEYYRRTNPDLARAEATGLIGNLHEHYLDFGYFEDRLPCEVEVDAAFYTREYPDVGAGILERTVKSAQWHFESFGFREGRLPRKGWSFAEMMDQA